MKIAIDATSLRRKLTGIEIYTLNLVKGIIEQESLNDFVFLFRKEVPPVLKEIKKKVKYIICPYDNQAFCEQFWIPYVIAKEKFDLIHFPAFPPSPLVAKPFVFTIHDASMWRFPEHLSWKGRYYFLPLTNLAGSKAARIVTVSEFSKRELETVFKRRSSDIINCGEAIDRIFNKESTVSPEKVRAKLGLPKRFILSVNSLEPRKNIPVLLRAFKNFKATNLDFDHKLVLVGRKAWGKDSVISEIKQLGLENAVILTGYVEPEELPIIYSMAEVFVYTSVYEGFGLPPLEAMACGIPAIVSDIPSLREVLGEAAFFVDPHNPDDISGGILQLLQSQIKKKDLIQKGIAKSGSYSWLEVTRKIAGLYESLERSFKTIRVLRAQIDNVTFKEALNVIVSLVDKRKVSYIVTPNVDHVVRLEKDKEFERVYNNASLVLADGMFLLWAAQLLNRPLKEKISGSDLFSRLCEISAKRGYKVFFLGGREGAAKKTAQVVRERYLGIKIAGCYCPPFGFEQDVAENERILTLIKEAKPDILFVGLGAPKQEKWIYKYKDQYQVPVSIGIGASFEFVSGMVRRAPVWMQKAGLEWFWRLLMEPQRLWKRYLIDDPIFFWLVLKQKFSKKQEVF